MPSVPPTFVSFDSDDVFLRRACAVSDISDALSASPTPDPELDERILVSVVTGDGVGTISSPDSLAAQVSDASMSLKPRINLANLSLHSPSPFVGTPFDVSPRFEYPFPPPCSNVEPDMTALPAFSIMNSPFMTLPPSFNSFPSLPMGRGETRGHSPAHPKLQARDPPVPPTLAKKRWSNAVNGPILSQHTLSGKRSGSVGPKLPTDGPDGPTSRLSYSQGASEERVAYRLAGDGMSSRESSRTRDAPRCRAGKEPEVIHSVCVGPRTHATSSSKMQLSERLPPCGALSASMSERLDQCPSQQLSATDGTAVVNPEVE